MRVILFWNASMNKGLLFLVKVTLLPRDFIWDKFYVKKLWWLDHLRLFQRNRRTWLLDTLEEIEGHGCLRLVKDIEESDHLRFFWDWINWLLRNWTKWNNSYIWNFYAGIEFYWRTWHLELWLKELKTWRAWEFNNSNPYLYKLENLDTWELGCIKKPWKWKIHCDFGNCAT